MVGVKTVLYKCRFADKASINSKAREIHISLWTQLVFSDLSSLHFQGAMIDLFSVQMGSFGLLRN